ncbi:bifunctional folylpolyglutamate synthase/dihydrofolate synthase [Alkalibacter saccharofermentans]|uniref:tetrahydrofolate synthase n=1 Tax=Alkalibacter saccharofermentans DSM 14828 TaxID=1120975 RepID=A0A1M4XDP6_9FIRM|nr:folylpolyglutamate synthase/dihydrofolate synthase family protein [Alkalibacter saccharofermentans]SHE91521.1 dihydrofolate synthase / folylpolyglutamate synthase [Alkalibacter saccharofermentans DSM 14828]
MNYQQALEYIHGTYMFGIKLGLDNITLLLKYLGDPHKNLKYVHIAGTNGKGSTSHMISNALTKSGYKTGLYISPYLEEFTERIQIDGNQIPKERLAKVTSKVKSAVDQMLAEGHPSPSEFELVTAIGFEYFSNENVDIVVLEVGMGGRFDATNVIPTPVVSVITSIGMDHTQYLGDTLEKIAFEKAGIIKDNSTVVLYPQGDEVVKVVKEKVDKTGSCLILPNASDISLQSADLNGQFIIYTKENSIFSNLEFKLSLLGDHQVTNSLTALTALEILAEKGYAVSKDAIRESMSSIVFPGRFERITESPLTIIDGAHNLNGFEALTKTLTRYLNKKINVVIGILGDKDYGPMLKEIAPFTKKFFTVTPVNPRALPAHELAEYIKVNLNMSAEELESIDSAAALALNSDSQEAYLFVGSLYMIGEARTSLNKRS